jgi:hypothetical protein
LICGDLKQNVLAKQAWVAGDSKVVEVDQIPWLKHSSQSTWATVQKKLGNGLFHGGRPDRNLAFSDTTPFSASIKERMITMT